jgi:peroxiredoxin
VVFTCNHCPYVKGSDAHLLKVVSSYLKDGLRVVAISSNDPAKSPEDGFEKMQEKAKSMQLPFPYLFDETQGVAKRFDAQCTPECYLFDRTGTLVYHGTVNDSPRDPTKVTKDYLGAAVAQLLEGQTVDPGFVHPVGCSIKWR